MAMNHKHCSGEQDASDDMKRAVQLRQPFADPFRAGAEVKARQSSKIRELGDALVTSGFHTLNEQAHALGLPRSTTWTILRGKHKASGLSAAVINQMLAAPQIPQLVRARILEYVEEKAAGSYGHSKIQLRRFVARLESIGHSQMTLSAAHQQRGSYREESRPGPFA